MNDLYLTTNEKIQSFQLIKILPYYARSETEVNTDHKLTITIR